MEQWLRWLKAMLRGERPRSRCLVSEKALIPKATGSPRPFCPQSCGSHCTWAEPARWGCTFPGTAPKWYGFFNYICLSWLHSRNHLSLPFSFQLFFLIYLCSSHLSSLPSKQAEEEKNAEKNRYAKKEKHVQTILFHNWKYFPAALPLIHPSLPFVFTFQCILWTKTLPSGFSLILSWYFIRVDIF